MVVGQILIGICGGIIRKLEWFNDTNQVYIENTERFNENNLIHEWTYKERKKFKIL